MEEFLQLYKAAPPAPHPAVPTARTGAGAQGPWAGSQLLGAQPSPARQRQELHGVAQDNNPPGFSCSLLSCPAMLPSLLSSAPRCSPLERLWFPGRAQDTGEGSVILSGGAGTRAMVVVSTGAEQTVPIRINPHPSCWSGLLRSLPPPPYGTAVPNTGTSLQFTVPAETLRSKNPKQRLLWCSLPFQGEQGWWEQFSVPRDESRRGHMGA